MSLSRVSRILIIFDALSFSSGLTNLSNRPIPIAFFRLLNIVLVSCFTYYKYHFVREFYSSYEIIDKVYGMLAYSVPLYAWWLVIIDSFLQQNSHKQFWTIIQQIDERYGNQSNYNHRPYMLKFIEFFLITTLFAFITLALALLHSSGAFLEIFFAFTHVVMLKVLHMRIFHYLFCLDLVNFHLQLIDCEIKSIKIYASAVAIENISQASKISFLSVKFNQFYEHSYCLFELVNHLNVVFGWSQVIAIPSCFYLLLTDLNWIFSFYDIISIAKLAG